MSNNNKMKNPSNKKSIKRHKKVGGTSLQL